MADNTTIIVLGTLGGLFLAKQQGLFGPPATEAKGTTTAGSPAGAAAKANRKTTPLSKRVLGGAVVAVHGTQRLEGDGSVFLKYHSLRIDPADSFQVYLRLQDPRNPGVIFKEVKLSNPPPPWFQRKIARYLMEQANELPEKLKCEGAERLNALVTKETGTNPGITCEDSVEEAVTKASGVAGAAVAAAGCSAVPGGAVLAPLCGMAGAYIGTYIGENVGKWLEGVWDAVSDFFKDAWDTINPF